MIDYCVSIPDREERTDCAYSIAHVMANLFPELKGEDNDMSKVWDQMMIMSQFKLDVDFPYEVITEEKFNPRPAPVTVHQERIALRHYGKYVEKMIPVIAEMEDSPERDELIFDIAHHMKKLMMLQDKDWVEDERILRDLALYSGGKIDLDPNTYILHEFKEAQTAKPTGNKKKKKK